MNIYRPNKRIFAFCVIYTNVNSVAGSTIPDVILKDEEVKSLCWNRY